MGPPARGGSEDFRRASRARFTRAAADGEVALALRFVADDPRHLAQEVDGDRKGVQSGDRRAVSARGERKCVAEKRVKPRRRTGFFLSCSLRRLRQEFATAARALFKTTHESMLPPAVLNQNIGVSLVVRATFFGALVARRGYSFLFENQEFFIY